MEHGTIERLGRDVSVVGLGTWQLGADWGAVDPERRPRDARGGGRGRGSRSSTPPTSTATGAASSSAASFTAAHPELFVATKMGRRVEQLTENYNRAAFLAWNDRSRQNLGVEHARPRAAPLPARRRLRQRRRVRRARRDGRRRADRGLRRLGRDLRAGARGDRAPGVATVQIILNCFRLKPLEEVLPAAHEAGVGIIARVPLASGLLSGRYDENTTFARRRPPQLQPPRRGVRRRRDVRRRAVRGRPARRSRAPRAGGSGRDGRPFALRWVIDQPGVSTVIPGARNPGAGARQRRRGLRCAAVEDQLAASRHLRPPDPRARPRPLVSAAAIAARARSVLALGDGQAQPTRLRIPVDLEERAAPRLGGDEQLDLVLVLTGPISTTSSWRSSAPISSALAREPVALELRAQFVRAQRDTSPGASGAVHVVERISVVVGS